MDANIARHFVRRTAADDWGPIQLTMDDVFMSGGLGGGGGAGGLSWRRTVVQRSAVGAFDDSGEQYETKRESCEFYSWPLRYDWFPP